MVKEKIEEKETKDDVKEKEIESKNDAEMIDEKEKTEEITEKKEAEKEIETPTIETEQTKEIELENDPWSAESWKISFPELFETEVVEKAEGVSKEDVIRICREQIKEWLKGTDRGDYPIPKSLKPTEVSFSNKTKDIEGLDEQLEKSATAYKSFEEKFQDIAKTFEEIKKEVQIIKDTPVDLIEKSMEKDKNIKYESKFKTLKDGTITIK